MHRYIRHLRSWWKWLVSPLKRLSTTEILSNCTYFYYIGFMKKGAKYGIKMTRIDQECYLCRRISPQPLVKASWFWHHQICLSKEKILMYNITMLLKIEFLTFSLCIGIFFTKGLDGNGWYLHWSVFLRQKFWGITRISITSGAWKKVKSIRQKWKKWSRVLSLSPVFSLTIGQS